MQKAIDAVRAGMSLCKAQKEFGIPKQTLSDRINGRWKSTKPGRTTALFQEEETALINYIKIWRRQHIHYLQRLLRRFHGRYQSTEVVNVLIL